jgi:hypothetical protein
VAALFAAATVAALSLPLDRGGIGWLVNAVVGTAALIVSGLLPYRLPNGVPPPLVRAAAEGDRVSPVRVFWSVVTVALLGVGTIRAAGWLFLLCVLTAMLTGMLAVLGARSMHAMALGAVMTACAGFRATGWFGRGVTAIRRPAAGKGSGRGSGIRVIATPAVSIALLVVFGALFASADPAFADLLERTTPSMDGATIVRWLYVFFASGFVLGGAAYLRAAPPRLSDLDSAPRRRVARFEWAVPLGLLVLLFIAFVAVQLAVLFGGSRHVLETDGLTYADYARGGFWQLLVVTGLSLAVLAGAARWAPRASRSDRTLIRVLLGALAVLTLVIVERPDRPEVPVEPVGRCRTRSRSSAGQRPGLRAAGDRPAAAGRPGRLARLQLRPRARPAAAVREAAGAVRPQQLGLTSGRRPTDSGHGQRQTGTHQGGARRGGGATCDRRPRRADPGR